MDKVIKALGAVFGDIGTSPIYTFTVLSLFVKPTKENIFGIVSLICWTLVIIVTIQYVFLAMNLSKRGEGGIIVLKEIATSLIKSSRMLIFITFLSYVGFSLMLGDSVITPAISILSAVEGLPLISIFSGLERIDLVAIAIIITTTLFFFQKYGIEKVGQYFGYIMTLWFCVLFISGLQGLSFYPEIIASINPEYAINFILNNGFASFLILSDIILAATGGEALYADMGHLGREPIVKAWNFVFIALLFNYLGQGAFFISHSNSKNIYFDLMNTDFGIFYSAILILTILATIIASQATISASFSLIYQGIITGILPMLRIVHTSTELKPQIFIPSVNWLLFITILVVLIIFQSSENLAAAYGFAVSGTMTITGILLTVIYFMKKSYLYLLLSIFVFCVDLSFFIANFSKIEHGAYITIIIACFILALILIYNYGKYRLSKALNLVDINEYIKEFKELYQKSSKVEGSAIFFVKDIHKIPPYIINTTLKQNIIYQKNILLSIGSLEQPFGKIIYNYGVITDGLEAISIKVGYMEILKLEKLLREIGINEKVIFFGIEDIFSNNPLGKIFAFIKRNTPSFVQFYNLPIHKTHGVLTRIKI